MITSFSEISIFRLNVKIIALSFSSNACQDAMMKIATVNVIVMITFVSTVSHVRLLLIKKIIKVVHVIRIVYLVVMDVRTLFVIAR